MHVSRPDPIGVSNVSRGSAVEWQLRSSSGRTLTCLLRHASIGIEVWVGYQTEDRALSSVVRKNVEDARATAQRFRDTALESGYKEFSEAAPANGSPVDHDRRTSQRLDFVVEVYGRSAPMQTPITLLNISHTGMAIRMETPLPLETPQRFHIHLADGTVVKLVGEVVRCESQGREYVVGVHFAYPIDDVFDDLTRGKTAESRQVNAAGTARLPR